MAEGGGPPGPPREGWIDSGEGLDSGDKELEDLSNQMYQNQGIQIG